MRRLLPAACVCGAPGRRARCSWGWLATVAQRCVVTHHPTTQGPLAPVVVPVLPAAVARVLVLVQVPVLVLVRELVQATPVWCSTMCSWKRTTVAAAAAVMVRVQDWTTGSSLVANWRPPVLTIPKSPVPVPVLVLVLVQLMLMPARQRAAPITWPSSAPLLRPSRLPWALACHRCVT